MLIIGVAVILALTFTPYALLQSARRAVTTYIQVPLSPAPASAVPAPSPVPPPTFDVAGWYAGRGDDPARHALLVQSLDGSVTLAEHNADMTYNPASLVKLTTSLVALRKLGKGYRFETKFYIDGEVDTAAKLEARIKGFRKEHWKGKAIPFPNALVSGARSGDVRPPLLPGG